MLLVTGALVGAGATSFPRSFTKKDRPGSLGIESRAGTEQIREICFDIREIRDEAVPAAAQRTASRLRLCRRR